MNRDLKDININEIIANLDMYLDIYEEEAYIEYQGNLDFLDEPFFIDT